MSSGFSDSIVCFSCSINKLAEVPVDARKNINKSLVQNSQHLNALQTNFKFLITKILDNKRIIKNST